VGEREGRVLSTLVRERSYGFAHGVGRSGDLLEVQPKALGSALLQRSTHALLRQALKVCGLHAAAMEEVIVVPTATGAAIMLALMGLRKGAPPARHKVLWLRVDQKSALKAIQATGLTPVVVENRLSGDEVVCDLAALHEAILREGPDAILAVVSCASCFAPRAPDPLPAIAKLCAQFGLRHVVNNAYGFQSRRAVNLLNAAVHQGGAVDAIVGSLDKNFGVPVGGAIITGPAAATVRAIGQVYPGRASSGPLIDLFVTLLSLGRAGLVQHLHDREVLFQYFKHSLRTFLPDTRLLHTPHNDVSMALQIDLPAAASAAGDSHLGSQLFYRQISGARLVTRSREPRLIDGIQLVGYGSHIAGYPVDYLNVASGIGQTKAEVDQFIARLMKLL
jgi:O-phospho-L-seryl-tRNASec:L-selenocysteinyl-tRNA synthase